MTTLIEWTEVLRRTSLRGEVLEIWIEAGWIVPQRRPDGPAVFSEADLARLQLIRDLREDLGLNDEAVPVVLDLVEQIYGLRRCLRDLRGAIADQPPAVRGAIAAALRARGAAAADTDEPPG